MTFEDALAKMEESVDKLRNPGTTLAESITSFEDGMKSYQLCMDLLHKQNHWLLDIILFMYTAIFVRIRMKMEN